MLILEVKKNQDLVIDNNIIMRLLDIKSNKIKLAFKFIDKARIQLSKKNQNQSEIN